MRKVIFLVSFCFLLFLIPLANAGSFGYNSQNDLGTFKQNEDLNIRQICNNATYITITSISYPDSSIAVSNISMTNTGYGEFNYTFNLTSQLGRYDVRGVSDGCEGTFVTYFEVTPSGFLVGENSAIIIIGSLIVMILMSLSFFYLGNKAEHIAAKVSLFSIAGIVFLMVSLFSVVTIQQTLYGIDSVVSGMETFLFVVKTLVTIGGLVFGVVIFLIMMKAWKIKRGHIDDY